jgi:hypothetical protein
LLPDLQQKLGLQVGAFHWPLPTGADEVSGEVVVDKSLSYILLLMVPNRCETGIIVHTVVFVFCLFLSFLVWNFLWLLEEVLTLLCFFFIFRMEISLFV